MKKIQDYSTVYYILYLLVRFAYNKFFRQIEVSGLENIPSREPVIFAPNHQSGLMDPLSVVLNQKNPMVFLARADIFNNKTFRGFLHTLKIMPVYRIRDGFENLTKNEEQFDICKDVLLDRKQLCVMPEGNHGHQHKLRPLVKGIFRIAFSAEEAMEGTSHVRIVPVSIDYNFYQHAGAEMVVRYGRPMEIEDYYPFYLENQAKAFNILKEDLSCRISEMMHDIRSIENYDLIYDLCCYGTPAYLEIQAEKGIISEAKTRAGRNFETRKSIGLKLDALEMSGSKLPEDCRRICAKLNKLPGYPSEITDLMEFKPNLFDHLLNFILILLHIPGLIMDTPALLVSKKVCKSIEDKQMHNTFSFVAGLILYPVMYLITAIILCIVLKCSFLQGFVLFFLLFAIGIIGERLRQYLKIPFRNLAWSFGKRRKILKERKEDYQTLKSLMKQILS